MARAGIIPGMLVDVHAHFYTDRTPRSDWRAPSDGTAAPWLDELKRAFED